MLSKTATVAELREEAKKRGLKPTTRQTKAELLALLAGKALAESEWETDPESPPLSFTESGMLVTGQTRVLAAMEAAKQIPRIPTKTPEQIHRLAWERSRNRGTRRERKARRGQDAVRTKLHGN